MVKERKRRLGAKEWWVIHSVVDYVKITNIPSCHYCVRPNILYATRDYIVGRLKSDFPYSGYRAPTDDPGDPWLLSHPLFLS
jgi:hypothetical protein